MSTDHDEPDEIGDDRLATPIAPPDDVTPDDAKPTGMTDALRVFFIFLIVIGVLMLLRVLFIKLGLNVDSDM